MKIDRDEVRRIAGLAHMELDDAGLDRMASEMTKILTYIDQLREVDVEGFEEHDAAATPMRDDEPRPSVDREVALNDREVALNDREVVLNAREVALNDREVALNDREVAARNAPAWRDGFFVVPKVIGGE